MTLAALSSRHERVLVLTLNRPQARNAVNAAMAAQASALLDAFEADPELRVCVLTGTGPSFCAGMDLKASLEGESARVGELGFLGLTNRRLGKPIIAAVEGHALGGGFETVLACDLVVASGAARFGLSEVKRGLAATGGGLAQLPRRLPINCAMEIVLTGEPMTAERAAELGLVNRLTPPGEALRTALQLAELIAANAPLAVAASKAAIRDQQDWPLADIGARLDAIAGKLKASEDAREGAEAFAQKRAPCWAGR